MTLSLRLLFLLLLINYTLVGQKEKPVFNDGPYVFTTEDSIEIKWIIQNVAFDTTIHKDQAFAFSVPGLPRVDLTNLSIIKDRKTYIEDVDHIVALSDVHGQYDLFHTLLTNQKVIDKEGNWNLGKGHLVIVGDNLDRGDKVIELLWHLFQLEKQAARVGGAVHVLLGNHEVMVLNGDLRYLHKKYFYTSALLKKKYDALFARKSVLGDWLASHNVVLSINSKVFVHGGISSAVLELNKNLEEINQVFKNKIIRANEKNIDGEHSSQTLYYNLGPLWYRGYFNTETITEDSIDLILNTLEQDAIIVGHTSQDSITSLFNNKVIAVDCSIKKGETGQVLWIDNETYSIGALDGTITPWIKPNMNEKPSLSQFILNQEGLPEIKFITDVKRLIRKSLKEEYQASFMEIKTPEKTVMISGRIRARGNIRKKQCRVPPVKFDSKKSTLDSLGFTKQDKLKFIFPCSPSDNSQERLYKEHFLYGLYALLDTNALKSKLVKISLENEKEVKFSYVGMLIEDEDEYARRKNAKIVSTGILTDAVLHRKSFLKMVFFQYMIANTDWGIRNKHNLEMVKLPDVNMVIALPYDFDYSGFVGQNYAIPNESLPIESIHERYYNKYKMSSNEFDAMIDYFLEKEKTIMAYCDSATYMTAKSIAQNKKYLQSFFDLCRKPKRIKSNFVTK